MEFKLPEIGEGIVEGELVKWLAKEGDQVQADQPVIEVMTDKATVEIPSPATGVLKGLKAKEGQMIKVGSVIATIEEGAGQSAQPTPAAPQASSASALQEAPAAKAEAPAPKVAPAQSNLNWFAPQGSQQQAQSPQYSQVSSAAKAAGGSSAAYQSPQQNLAPSSVPAAPLVRSMASKAGVDLAEVPASGPAVGGRARVLEEDLIRYMNSKEGSFNNGEGAVRAGASTFGSPLQSSAATERKPLRGLRRVIAQAMVKSKYTAPHYSYVDEFECSALVEMREQAKKAGEKLGVKVTYLPFIVKALVGALKEFPIVNSSLEETADGSMELVYKKFYNIGFAVATNDGLIVPVIKNADRKNLLDIAREIADLSERTRNGKAAPDELKGSTFTITSLGNAGGLFATPIINYPEVGIMGVYKIQERPIVKNGQIVVGKTMHLSLSLDHRVVDGAVGANFCNAVIERLANPTRLLLELV